VRNKNGRKIAEEPGFAGEMPPVPGLDGPIAGEQNTASAMPLHQHVPARFTLDGSPELERHLASVCEKVATEVRALIPSAKLDGLLLGGGYGRCEGGVLRTGTGDQPYNDLEFYVFVRGNALFAERKYRAALHAIGHRLSPEAGLEVEFKVLTLEKLRRAAPSMFFYDLVSGHRWLVGDDSLLAGCEHHGAAGDIPLHEATRLLMNRCSGLLFSAERLRRAKFGPDEADFVGRNLAKIQLALGDVLLTAAGQYHWSCQERHERLVRLEHFGNEPWRDALCRQHTAGVGFKLHPVRSTANHRELSQQHTELSGLARQVWLWLENLRLKTDFVSPREYALSAADKCPETSALRNRLVNAKTFGPAAGLPAGSARYPRQRLFHALCLLLWDPEALADAARLQVLQRELNTRAADFAGLVAAYEQLWHRFN
jgi:hypothetical protein